MSDRREFIQKSAIGVAGLTVGSMAMSAKSYGRIIGANDRVKVAILGFSGRFESAFGNAIHVMDEHAGSIVQARGRQISRHALR